MCEHGFIGACPECRGTIDLGPLIAAARAIGAHSVSFGVSLQAYRFLATRPDARKTITLYSDSDRQEPFKELAPVEEYVIEAVTVVVDGVALRVQAPSRPPTPQESGRARAQENALHDYRYRSCAL